MKTILNQGQLSHGPSYVFFQANFWAKGLLILALIAAFGYASAQNCTPTNYDLHGFHYDVTSGPQGEINIQCYLGTVAEPMQNFLGTDLTIKLSESQSAGVSASIDFSQGWFQTDGNHEERFIFDPEQGTISVAWQRHDCITQTGNGLFAVITLSSETSTNSLSDLVVATTGIVIIDNISPSKRFEHGQTELDVQVGPNPTSDYLKVWGQTAGATYTLVSTNGSLVQTGRFASEEQEILDLSHLNPGCYLFTVQHEDQRIIRRIMVQ